MGFRWLVNLIPSSGMRTWAERHLMGTPIGHSSSIGAFTQVIGMSRKELKIGRNVWIGGYCTFLVVGGGLEIGDDVVIATRAMILSHSINNARERRCINKKVTIKNGAYICAGATILPGVTVGENAVVASGSVVNKDVPPSTLVGGVPARFIKKI